MIQLHCLDQIIIFDFQKQIPGENRWWLSVPKLNNINLRETHKSTETHKYVSACFPHLGTFIGLTKDAAAIFLVGMGLPTTLKRGNTKVCSQVWFDICETFKTNFLYL